MLVHFELWALLTLILHVHKNFKLSILQDITSPASEEENLLMSLITMGYKKEEATTAIERCGIIYVLSSVHIADLVL